MNRKPYEVIMSDIMPQKALKPIASVERITENLSVGDLNDLCDATEAAIEAGGGFGWVELPNRGILERFWQGVMAMPVRILLVARLDGVICGTAQLVRPPKNNEAQAASVSITGLFIAPWARGQGLSRRLLDLSEKTAMKEGFKVINLDIRETQTAAIKLYESNGYHLIGTHPYYAMIDDKYVAGRYYYKLLSH
jgi:ribosomal protein S18 acetylase RimI-like enzyme